MRTAYIVAIVLAVVVVVAIVTKAVVVHVLKKKGREEILKTCSIVDDNTIFVSVVSVGDAVAAGSTIHTLFKEARCPLRVHVGVCEIYNDDGSTAGNPQTAVDVYKDLCTNSTSPFCLTDNIRVLRVPLSEAHGTFAAREHIERYLYRSETYVATVACPVTMSKNWDDYCIEALAKLDGRRVVLTTLLGPPSSDSHVPCAVAQPGTYIGVTGTTPVLLNEQAVDVPTFGAFRIKHVPTYRDGSDENTVHLLPSIAWSSSFSFSHGTRIDEVPFPRNGSWSVDPFEDVIMTCRLLQAKWGLYCPTGCVGQRGSDTNVTSLYYHQGSDMCGVPRFHADLARTTNITPDIIKSLGITRGRVSARARLGLSRAPNEHELRGKIGSTTEYLSLLARIDLTAHKEST